jgi:hypothetical protein
MSNLQSGVGYSIIDEGFSPVYSEGYSFAFGSQQGLIYAISINLYYTNSMGINAQSLVYNYTASTSIIEAGKTVGPCILNTINIVVVPSQAVTSDILEISFCFWTS